MISFLGKMFWKTLYYTHGMNTDTEELKKSINHTEINLLRQNKFFFFIIVSLT